MQHVQVRHLRRQGAAGGPANDPAVRGESNFAEARRRSRTGAQCRGGRGEDHMPAPAFEPDDRLEIAAIVGIRKTDPMPARSRPVDPDTNKPIAPRKKFVLWKGWERSQCSWEVASHSGLEPTELIGATISVTIAGRDMDATIASHIAGNVYKIEGGDAALGDCDVDLMLPPAIKWSKWTVANCEEYDNSDGSDKDEPNEFISGAESGDSGDSGGSDGPSSA